MIGLRVRSVAFVAIITIALLATTRLAKAESVLVVLASPVNGGETTSEVLNRIRGELLADHFNVQVVDAMAKADRVAILTRTGRETSTALTAGLFVEDGARTLELCLVDTLTGNVLARSLAAEPNSQDQTPQVLARRAVDFLRASLLDFLVESLRSAMKESHEPANSIPRVETTDRATKLRWALEAGVGVLGSFEGVGPALVPLVRVRRALRETVQLRMTGAWLGTQPRVETAMGVATVDQGIALLECVARLSYEGPFRPLFSLGAGTYYVAVSGSGTSPYSGVRNSEFAFALDAGLGVATPLVSQLEMVFELHALVTGPGLAVRFLDADAARIGRPSVLGTITVVGSI